jgi:cell division cycle protein 20 (cofactor of APC complex)
MIAVALNQTMYVWRADTGQIDELFTMSNTNATTADTTDDYISSCSWIKNSMDVLAVGNSRHQIELWDVNVGTKVRTMRSQTSRVGSLSWNVHILTSGSRYGDIHHHDVRIADHHVGSFEAHSQEVCGLKWSPDGRYLASGGNDNMVAIWDWNFVNTRPLHTFREHDAAVKALAWCPWQHNVLATGGGTACGHIKVWNAGTGACLQSVDARSQISAILWSKHHRELITSHGYRLNQLSLWKFPEMTKVCDLKGHADRVLGMALSPDENTVASIGADETLRLWKCFAPTDGGKKRGEGSLHDSGIGRSASYNSLTRSIR